MIHKPVLTKEVLEYLNPKPGENFIDATVGEGGHARLILEKTAPNGKLIGIDWDQQQIKNSQINLTDFKDRIILENSSYVDVKNIAQKNGFERVDGILVDLGYSSWQIESLGRGFSFQKDEALDMRYSENTELTAQKIVNEYGFGDLVAIFKEYGEEKFAESIANEIIESRKTKSIYSTFDLNSIIQKAVSKRYLNNRLHYATRVFQALRIAVNDELSNIKTALNDMFSILADGGRLGVISFHSLEDRIVKNFFKDKEKENLLKILTKKPIVAALNEARQNPRARSAKLRVISKVSDH